MVSAFSFSLLLDGLASVVPLILRAPHPFGPWESSTTGTLAATLPLAPQSLAPALALVSHIWRSPVSVLENPDEFENVSVTA